MRREMFRDLTGQKEVKDEPARFPRGVGDAADPSSSSLRTLARSAKARANCAGGLSGPRCDQGEARLRSVRRDPKRGVLRSVRELPEELEGREGGRRLEA